MISKPMNTQPNILFLLTQDQTYRTHYLETVKWNVHSPPKEYDEHQ